MIDYPIAFLYRPDAWPPEPLVAGNKFVNRLRDEYPLSEYHLSDFLDKRTLWVNVWTRVAKWSTGELVRWNGWENDIHFDENPRTPIGLFINWGERLVVDNWVFIPNHATFFQMQEQLLNKIRQHAFSAGDNSGLRQAALF